MTTAGTVELGGDLTPQNRPPTGRRHQRRPSRRRFWLRRIMVGGLALLIVLGTWFAWSFSGYVRDSQGEPTNVLLAEWGREHYLGPVVAKVEDVYYALFNKTPTGGQPTEAALFGPAGTPAPTPRATPSAHASGSHSASATPVPAHDHLTPPATLVSPAGSPVPGEGVWQPVASPVAGRHAIYATRVRPDADHTSVLASLMWIDTKLTKAMFVPGYIEPGGPSPSDGALPQSLQSSVLANFNGAFRLQDSRGGYYYRGQTVADLQDGRASAVIGKDGSITVGKWGRDLSMTSGVAVVRQNLDLIVDHGRSQVDAGQNFDWGATTHGETYAWRSALGQRADGSLVYIGSPGLSAQSMAATLVSAGVQRAMVLDMNNWWVAGFYFTHDASGAPVCAKLDPNIAEGCDRFLNRYKRDSFQILAAP